MPAHFRDECGHGRSCFYGSTYRQGRFGDIYFYKSFGVWSYCFRYGAEGRYESAPILDLLYSVQYSDNISREKVIELTNDDRELVGMFLKFISLNLEDGVI